MKPEQRLARQRAAKRRWRLKNPEAHRKAVRAWRAKNRDADRASSKAWRLANPERHKARVIAFYEKNPNYYAELYARRKIKNALLKFSAVCAANRGSFS